MFHYYWKEWNFELEQYGVVPSSHLGKGDLPSIFISNCAVYSNLSMGTDFKQLPAGFQK